MAMTKAEKHQCEDIIHGHAWAVIGGSLIPGVGTPINVAALTTMTMALANVFNVSMSETLAATTAVNALKEFAGKMVVSEFVKIFPGLGSIASAALTVTMIESAGWQIAENFANQRR